MIISDFVSSKCASDRSVEICKRDSSKHN